MADQEQNLCLLQLPLLVIQKILSNVHNRTNVSRTCKCVYEIVCDMEVQRHVICLNAYQTAGDGIHSTIDDDAVFDSIMNSARTIKEIRLNFGQYGHTTKLRPRNKRSKRLTAIMKHFGADIKSLKLREFDISIHLILEWLHQMPKLESLSFVYGKTIGPAIRDTVVPLQLSNLKSLEIRSFDGLLDIVNLIPAGALNSYRYHDKIEQSTEAAKFLNTILTKQHNIKSLHLYGNCDPSVLCLDQLQLETLMLMLDDEDTLLNDKLVEILKSQKNLKQLRLITCQELSENAFKWFCTNLKKLEVLEVGRLDPLKEYSFRMLRELKNLRHFRTFDLECLDRNAFQIKSDSLEKLKISDCRIAYGAGERLNRTVRSVVQLFINLTHLEMAFDDFSGIISVLSHCKTLTDLRSEIRNPSPDKLIRQRFPNIKYLQLSNTVLKDFEPWDVDQILVIIVHAMPNLNGLSLEISRLTFNMNTIKEFVRGSPSLNYLYVHNFDLESESESGVSSTADVVETIRLLLAELKGYQLIFNTTNERKYELANIFYVRRTCRSDLNLSQFQLRKGEVKKFKKDV